jgi:DNA repair protein RadC
MGNLHEGHRSRLKKRFLTEGLDHFEPHQVLELMLFYAIPQKDTNPLAHELIQRFGSFAGVLNASVEDLMTVDGIKENAATYLKMFTSVFRVYEQTENQKAVCFDTLDKIAEFAKKQFVGLTRERVYALFLNNRLQKLECFLVSEGTVNSAPVVPRIIAQKAFQLEASSLVLMHNHPQGIAVASPDDLRLTRVIEHACNVIGIYFLDHLIVAGDNYTSILRKSKGYERVSPLSGALDPDFYRSFYKDVDDDEHASIE